jgi:hypothetical protein
LHWIQQSHAAWPWSQLASFVRPPLCFSWKICTFGRISRRISRPPAPSAAPPLSIAPSQSALKKSFDFETLIFELILVLLQ